MTGVPARRLTVLNGPGGAGHCFLAGRFFGGLLFQDRVPAAGDFPAFYEPLLRWTQAEWSAGRLPLWNPRQSGPTAGGRRHVERFLPRQALLLLPIPWEKACASVPLVHVVLAAGGAYRLARHWQCSRTAAGLAALSYALAGRWSFNTATWCF